MNRAFRGGAVLLAAFVLMAAGASAADLPFVYEKWESFTVENTKGGLPNDHIFAVKVDARDSVKNPRIWVGTEDGLACFEKGKWQNWQMKDGLPWKVVTGIDVDPRTGDVWLALFGGGLARFSGGRFDHWHQLNSGLVNDVVYGVAVQDNYLWAATTAGASRLNLDTQEWTVFTEKNAPMEEIWNYDVFYGEGKVWLSVWGSGWLEFDVKTGNWKEYLDPDGEMEIDLFRDDGPIHVITTAAAYHNGILWGSTYFGVSRYDGRNWRGYTEKDSGLASTFNNNIMEHEGEGWCCTDKGLSACVDYDTNTWVTYRRDGEGTAGTARITQGTETIEVRALKQCLPNNFIINGDFAPNHDVWVATSKGLARGSGKGWYPGVGKSGRKIARPEQARAAVIGKEKP